MAVSELVLPQKNFFGEGAVGRIAGELVRSGIRTALLVSDRGVGSSGLLDRIAAPFTEAGIALSTDAGLSGEPTVSEVLRVSELVASSGAEALIGVGGGSVMDLTKAAALTATNGPDLRRRVGYNRHEVDPVPFFLVSTAAGTAAELSRAFLITDDSVGEKLVFKDDRALAAATACDAQLMTGLPASVTAAGGMDALAHSLEGYLGRKSWGLSRVFAVQAARLVLDNLPAALATPTDIGRREALIHAQTLAGLSLGSAGVGMGHAIGHPLGSRTHLAHGRAVGMLLPYVLEYTFAALPEAADRLARDLCGPAGTPRDVVTAVGDLAAAVGVARPGDGAPLSDADIEWIVDHAVEEPNMPNSAVTPSRDDIRRVLVDAWEGRELRC